jgi:folylpolyglutamate synthase/dihydropteroate synthase
MLLKLKDSFDKILITEVHMERSLKIRDLQGIASELNIRVEPAEDPAAVVRKFSELDSKHSLVVLGSMYLLGEIKSLLKENKIA